MASKHPQFPKVLYVLKTLLDYMLGHVARVEKMRSCKKISGKLVLGAVDR
jgi:hypothetical protein